MNKKILFKIISLVLIQAFLLLDAVWAGGTDLISFRDTDHLSPAVKINNQLLIENFQKLYQAEIGVLKEKGVLSGLSAIDKSAVTSKLQGPDISSNRSNNLPVLAPKKSLTSKTLNLAGRVIRKLRLSIGIVLTAILLFIAVESGITNAAPEPQKRELKSGLPAWKDIESFYIKEQEPPYTQQYIESLLRRLNKPYPTIDIGAEEHNYHLAIRFAGKSKDEQFLKPMIRVYRRNFRWFPDPQHDEHSPQTARKAARKAIDELVEHKSIWDKFKIEIKMRSTRIIGWGLTFIAVLAGLIWSFVYTFDIDIKERIRRFFKRREKEAFERTMRGRIDSGGFNAIKSIMKEGRSSFLRRNVTAEQFSRAVRELVENWQANAYVAGQYIKIFGVPKAVPENLKLLRFLVRKDRSAQVKAQLIRLQAPVFAPLLNAVSEKDKEKFVSQVIPSLQANVRGHFTRGDQVEVLTLSVNLGLEVMSYEVSACEFLSHIVPLAIVVSKGDLAVFRKHLGFLKNLLIKAHKYQCSLTDLSPDNEKIYILMYKIAIGSQDYRHGSEDEIKPREVDRDFLTLTGYLTEKAAREYIIEQIPWIIWVSPPAQGLSIAAESTPQAERIAPLSLNVAEIIDQAI